MSNRSLIEINHDLTPGRSDEALLAWAKKMRNYLGSANPDELPDGVRRLWYRHHSDPCPFDQPLAFELRHPRSRMGKK